VPITTCRAASPSQIDPRFPDPNKQAPVYAEINGLKMLYEIHGTGDPVVLLHGTMSATATSFGPLLNALAQTRQVVAMDQQGHGPTADIDRPLSVAQMADDALALLANPGSSTRTCSDTFSARAPQ
jgi:hypothetical protein